MHPLTLINQHIIIDHLFLRAIWFVLSMELLFQIGFLVASRLWVLNFYTAMSCTLWIIWKSRNSELQALVPFGFFQQLPKIPTDFNSNLFLVSDLPASFLPVSLSLMLYSCFSELIMLNINVAGGWHVARETVIWRRVVTLFFQNGERRDLHSFRRKTCSVNRWRACWLSQAKTRRCYVLYGRECFIIQIVFVQKLRVSENENEVWDLSGRTEFIFDLVWLWGWLRDDFGGMILVFRLFYLSNQKIYIYTKIFRFKNMDQNYLKWTVHLGFGHLTNYYLMIVLDFDFFFLFWIS